MEIPLLILCIVVIILFAMILSYYINNYINQKNQKMHSNLAFQSIYVGDNKTFSVVFVLIHLQLVNMIFNVIIVKTL